MSIANFRFSPDTVSIRQGDKVTWSWVGPDRNHTVTSDPGQAESFDSHAGIPTGAVADGPPGETFSHTFTKTGTFTYFCRVHTFMHGKVTVVAPGAPLPDTTPPATRLRILSSSLRRVVRTRKLRVRLGVSEAATEKLRAKAFRRTIARKSVTFRSAGAKTVVLKLTTAGRRGLAGRKRARITVIARARDAAGNVKTVRKSKTLS